jgi:hypothetical protein
MVLSPAKILRGFPETEKDSDAEETPTEAVTLHPVLSVTVTE